jgi:hypothetical protein
MPKKPPVKASQILLSIRDISEKDKFDLAKWILLGVVILLVLSSVAYFENQIQGQKIFDAAFMVLPPIATLILGYYFAQPKQ